MKSVRNALRVFEEVAASQPVGLSELARTLDMPKSSVQRALNTLADSGWLRYDLAHPGAWVVTARFSVLADASPAVIAARDASRSALRALADATGGNAGLFVLDGDQMVLVAGPEEQTLRLLDAELGPLPVHLSAAGRAILSRLPDATVDDLLDRTLRSDPDRRDRVRAAITSAAADGYAVVDGEYRPGLGVVAAAVASEVDASTAVAVIVDADRLRDGGAARIGEIVVATAATVAAAVAGPYPHHVTEAR